MRRGGWVGFVATRWYSSGNRSGPSLAPATAGIAIGVAALLCVIGVMNGFQMGFIDAVLDLDSYHVRFQTDSANESADAVMAVVSNATAVLPFVDIRTMASNERGKAAPLRIKVVPDDIQSRDPAFASRLEFRSGSFEGGLVVGSELARYLNLRVGDTVSVLAVSADDEEGLDVGMVDLAVAGIYHCGYYDFDAALAFLPASAAGGLGAGEQTILGLRLSDRYGDARALAELSAAGMGGAESWREYNRAFFGALRMEKSVMLLLVGLIFIVVGVNIFHSLRKAVYNRVDDIATMKALGANSRSVQAVFLLDGIAAGLGGAFSGLALGLLLAFNVNGVFSLVETMVGALYGVFGSSGPGFEFFSPDLFYIGDVPVRLSFAETLFITSAGAASALAAAWAASSRVSRIMPSEVLRDE